MENEIMNNGTIEGIVETGKVSGVKKGAIALGIIGLATGLGFGIIKLGKKLKNKVKARKSKKLEKKESTNDIFDDDFDSDLTDEELGI